MKPLLWMFRFVFVCHHSQLSRVFTIQKRTYQVCMKCGKEVEYSWALMNSVPPNPAGHAHAPRNDARHSPVSVM